MTDHATHTTNVGRSFDRPVGQWEPFEVAGSRGKHGLYPIRFALKNGDRVALTRGGNIRMFSTRAAADKAAKQMQPNNPFIGLMAA